MTKRLTMALLLACVIALLAGCADKGDEKTAATANPEVTAETTGEAATGGAYMDGTYEGVARGYKRGLNVIVTVKDGKIADVAIGDNNEDEPYLTDSLVIIEEIIETQVIDVDAVSSATKTCDGIEKAIVKALEQAAAQ